MREQLYRIPGEQSNGAASWHSSAYKLRMSPVLPNYLTKSIQSTVTSLVSTEPS
jgi:hypothetical protein